MPPYSKSYFMVTMYLYTFNLLSVGHEILRLLSSILNCQDILYLNFFNVKPDLVNDTQGVKYSLKREM